MSDAYNMYYMSDDQFFFKTTSEIKVAGKTVEHSHIFILDAQFGNFEVS
jgi:hypothetical protein